MCGSESWKGVAVPRVLGLFALLKVLAVGALLLYMGYTRRNTITSQQDSLDTCTECFQRAQFDSSLIFEFGECNWIFPGQFDVGSLDNLLLEPRNALTRDHWKGKASQVQHYLWWAGAATVAMIIIIIVYFVFLFGDCRAIVDIRNAPLIFALLAFFAFLLGLAMLTPLMALSRLYLDANCYVSAYAPIVMTVSLAIPAIAFLVLVILFVVLILTKDNASKPHISVPISAFVLVGAYVSWIMYNVVVALKYTHDWYALGVSIVAMTTPIEVLAMLIIAVVEADNVKPASETTPYAPVATDKSPLV